MYMPPGLGFSAPFHGPCVLLSSGRYWPGTGRATLVFLLSCSHTLSRALPAQGNLIDDDLMRMLMTGLIRNSTITYLDVSHNKITNHGQKSPRALCSKFAANQCAKTASRTTGRIEISATQQHVLDVVRECVRVGFARPWVYRTPGHTRSNPSYCPQPPPHVNRVKRRACVTASSPACLANNDTPPLA